MLQIIKFYEGKLTLSSTLNYLNQQKRISIFNDTVKDEAVNRVSNLQASNEKDEQLFENRNMSIDGPMDSEMSEREPK